MKYGLEEEEWNKLIGVFSQYSEIDSVKLYGSRAKGTNDPFSDVDITLAGKNLNRHILNSVALQIDDLLLPYQFDISIFENLKDQDLIDHINRVGVYVYKA